MPLPYSHGDHRDLFYRRAGTGFGLKDLLVMEKAFEGYFMRPGCQHWILSCNYQGQNSIVNNIL